MFVFFWPEDFVKRMGLCFGAIILVFLAFGGIQAAIHFGVELQVLLMTAAFVALFFVPRGWWKLGMISVCIGCLSWAVVASEAVTEDADMTNTIGLDVSVQNGCSDGCRAKASISEAIAYATTPDLVGVVANLVGSYDVYRLASIGDPAAAQFCSVLVTAAYRVSHPTAWGERPMEVEKALDTSGPTPSWVSKTLTPASLSMVGAALGRPYPSRYGQPDLTRGKVFAADLGACGKRFPSLNGKR